MATQTVASPGLQNRSRQDNIGYPELRGQKLSTFLGWFGIALGTAELIVPGMVAKIAGLKKGGLTTRLFGLREIAAGIGILTSPRRTGWVQARVAGDALDLTALALASKEPGLAKAKTVFATVAVAGVTAMDVICAQQLASNDEIVPGDDADSGTVDISESFLINKSPEECYRYYREFTNLPRFMKYLDSVEIEDEKRSRWTATTPIGGKLSWVAEITEDKPGERISWKSAPDSAFENNGTVEFSKPPNGQGTLLRSQFWFKVPAGPVSSLIAKAAGDAPSAAVREDLRRFKAIIEAGEIPTTEGQTSGRAAGARQVTPTSKVQKQQVLEEVRA